MERRIMICLEKLDIGGVETAVLNQATALKSEGNEVIVLAQNGIYKEVLENKGITCINFTFEIEKNYNTQKINQVRDIIKEYKIDQVHIHQFPCITSVMPACIIENIPYVSYLHMGVVVMNPTYEWYINSFPIFDSAFSLFFSNANKIICITNENIENNQNRYHLPKDRYLLINNSINLDLYSFKERDNDKKNWLLISRISKEKEKSVKKAIDFFIQYADINNLKNIKLSILGDGDKFDSVKEYIQEKNKNHYLIDMLGASNDVRSYIDKNDIILGLGRCLLEAIAMKKIAINVRKTGIKGLVTPNNIEDVVKRNFCVNEEDYRDEKQTIEDLNQLSVEEIKKIVDKNYEYIKQTVDIKNNLFYIKDIITKPYDKTVLIQLFEAIANLNQYKIDNESQVYQLKAQKEEMHHKLQEKQEELERLKNEKDNIEQELNSIYQSKRWNYVNKLANIFGKKS